MAATFRRPVHARFDEPSGVIPLPIDIGELKRRLNAAEPDWEKRSVYDGLISCAEECDRLRAENRQLVTALRHAWHELNAITSSEIAR